MRKPFITLLWCTVAAAAATIVLWLTQPSGQVALRPGPVINTHTATRGEITDPAYGDHGHFLVTTVKVEDLSNGELLRTHLPGGHTELAPLAPVDTSTAVARQQLRASQRTAASVAAHHTGTTQWAPQPAGALIVYVATGSPAAAAGLQPADVITAINEQPVTSDTELVDALTTHEPGETVTFRIERDGTAHQISVTLNQQRKAGIQIATAFNDDNVPISINLDGVGGGSAGLMLTLAFIDAWSPGDLTGNLTIAGTGAITIDGTVDPVSGVHHKVLAAADAGAEAFFVPAGNAHEAVAGTHHISVIPIGTIDDALDWLCAQPDVTDHICDPTTRH